MRLFGFYLALIVLWVCLGWLPTFTFSLGALYMRSWIDKERT